MLLGITVLIVFQLVGEVVAYFLGGLIPGPVIGMILVALALLLSRGRDNLHSLGEKTSETSRLVLANLGLLFVPAGVGIIKHVDLIIARGPALIAVIVLSTTTTLVVTVWVFLFVKRLANRGSND